MKKKIENFMKPDSDLRGLEFCKIDVIHHTTAPDVDECNNTTMLITADKTYKEHSSAFTF